MKITVDTKVGELIPEGNTCFKRTKEGKVAPGGCPFLYFDWVSKCQLTGKTVFYDFMGMVCNKCPSCPKPPVEEVKK